jgi:hypothetical protein
MEKSGQGPAVRHPQIRFLTFTPSLALQRGLPKPPADRLRGLLKPHRERLTKTMVCRILQRSGLDFLSFLIYGAERAWR